MLSAGAYLAPSSRSNHDHGALFQSRRGVAVSQEWKDAFPCNLRPGYLREELEEVEVVEFGSRVGRWLVGSLGPLPWMSSWSQANRQTLGGADQDQSGVCLKGFILYSERLPLQDWPCIYNMKSSDPGTLMHCAFSKIIQPGFNSLLMVLTVVTSRSQRSWPSEIGIYIPRTPVCFGNKEIKLRNVWGVCHLDLFLGPEWSITPLIVSKSPGLFPTVYSRVAPTVWFIGLPWWHLGNHSSKLFWRGSYRAHVTNSIPEIWLAHLVCAVF